MPALLENRNDNRAAIASDTRPFGLSPETLTAFQALTEEAKNTQVASAQHSLLSSWSGHQEEKVGGSHGLWCRPCKKMEDRKKERENMQMTVLSCRDSLRAKRDELPQPKFVG